MDVLHRVFKHERVLAFCIKNKDLIFMLQPFNGKLAVTIMKTKLMNMRYTDLNTKDGTYGTKEMGTYIIILILALKWKIKSETMPFNCKYII